MQIVNLDNAKYTLQYDEKTNKLTCLRYGTACLDFSGDTYKVALFKKIKEAEHASKHPTEYLCSSHETASRTDVMLDDNTMLISDCGKTYVQTADGLQHPYFGDNIMYLGLCYIRALEVALDQS